MAEEPAAEEIRRWHRWMAVDLFNRAWRLLESERGPDEDRELLASALASWLHWRRVGEPANFAVSDWQVARVCTVLGDTARAEEYAWSSLRIAQDHHLGAFYVGYAYEALARAAAVAGDREARRAWLDRAEAEAGLITDGEERGLLLADLESV